jgi:hypothetical protein
MDSCRKCRYDEDFGCVIFCKEHLQKFKEACGGWLRSDLDRLMDMTAEEFLSEKTIEEFVDQDELVHFNVAAMADRRELWLKVAKWRFGGHDG